MLNFNGNLIYSQNSIENLANSWAAMDPILTMVCPTIMTFEKKIGLFDFTQR